jgi:signal transduction histidine kinase
VREVVSHGRRILVAFDPVYVPARQEQYLVILNAPVRPLPPSVRDVAPLIVASVLALILAQLLWAVVIRRLTRPLEAMSAWAARLAAGDLAARPEVSEGVEELRRLAASLTRLAETLSAEHDRREAFLAEVAHDLRTPLSVQRTLLMSLGRAGEPGVDVPRLARQMQAETERLIRLVNNLLDMARLEAGSVPLERERLDLREPVAMAAASFEVLARGRGVRLAMALGDAPVPAFADADRVTQIVTNLIDNAVRHAGDGGHVEVRTALDERRERALLEVVDSGPGVAPGARRTLWQRFGGGGLGLAISRALARAMDGDLELAPELPTRFVLSLPARPAP